MDRNGEAVVNITDQFASSGKLYLGQTAISISVQPSFHLDEEVPNAHETNGPNPQPVLIPDHDGNPVSGCNQCGEDVTGSMGSSRLGLDIIYPMDHEDRGRSGITIDPRVEHSRVRGRNTSGLVEGVGKHNVVLRELGSILPNQLSG